MIKTLLGLTITSALVVLLVRYLDWPQLLSLAKRASWPILLGTMPLYLTRYLLRTCRFALLAEGTPFATLFAITSVHNLMLRILPMRTGELSYGILMRKTGAAGLGESLLGLLLLRLLDITVVVVCFAMTLAASPEMYQGDSHLAGWIAASIAAGGLFMIAFFRPLSLFAVKSMTFTMEILGLTRFSRIARATEKLSASVESFGRLPYKTLLTLFAITAGTWFTYYAMISAVMQGFAIRMSFRQVVLGGTAPTVGAFLPVGGIGSFGTLEAGWALGFALVGVAPHLAVASGFAYSLITLFWAIILAAFGWRTLGALKT